MGLCGHCKQVEIAWHSDSQGWVAYHAEREADGTVRRKLVNVEAGRKANRPVPDLGRRHYPHINRTGGPSTSDECPAWTLEAARAVKRGKGRSWRTPAHLAVPLPPTPALGVETPVVEADKLPPELDVALRTDTFGAPVGGWTHAGPPPSNAPATGPTVATVAQAVQVPMATLGAQAVMVVPGVKAQPKLPGVGELMSLEARQAWMRAEKILECGDMPTRLMLWGPPGTGKTELPWRHAKKHGWAHEYQLMTEETPGSDLLGHLAVEGGNTVWLDGSVCRAIRKSHAGPVVLVVDEIGRASADALSACLMALTNPESLRLTTRAGEVLAPKVENWHVVVTSNDDPSLLPVAIADRLHLAVMLTAPHPELVESLTTAEARRLACATSREYSIRALLSYDRLRAAGWSLKDAAELVWEPYVARSFQDAVKIAGRVV